MHSISVITVLVLAFTYALAFDATLDQHWQLWKKTHNKQYAGVEENPRRAVWESNLQIVQSHNLEADLGVHTYWLGMNEYADMTTHEFVQQMNGYNSTLQEDRSQNRAVFTFDPNLQAPTAIDWRTKGYVTGVKNQGQCGSCWAFSSTGALEGQHYRKTGRLVSLSEQNLVDCSRAQGNMGCNGGLMDHAFQYIKVNNGIDTETSYPYEARDASCRFKRADVGATDTGYVDVRRSDEKALEQAVGTVGPVSVAIDASHSSFQLYRSGVYHEPACSSTRLDHGVLVVGYGAQGNQAYWIVKNSWGASWGERGYILMSRNRNNQCGIATSASYPTV